MARETKVSLLVGVCVILLVGIIVSDHLSVVGQQTPAALTAWAPGVQNRLTHTNQDVPDPSGNTAPGEHAYQPPAPIPAPNDPPAVRDAVHTPPGPTPHGPDNDGGVVPPLRPTTPNDPRLARGNAPISPLDNPGPGIAPGIQILDTHTVQHGDTLYKLAKAYYHRGDKWKAIALANPSVVDAEGHLRDGTALVIPKLADAAVPTNVAPLPRPDAPGQPGMTPPPQGGLHPTNGGIGGTGGIALHGDGGTPPASGRFVMVERDDTLGKLATRYLGARNRWGEILNLNRDKLQLSGDLRIGMKLRLPEAHSAIPPTNPPVLAIRPPAAPRTPATAMTRVPAPTGNPGTVVTPGAGAPGAGIRTPQPRDPSTFDLPDTPWPTDGATPSNPVVIASRRQIIYTVKPSDSLPEIAAKTLGDSRKWPIILNANRQALAGEEHLQIGQRLVVPISPG